MGEVLSRVNNLLLKSVQKVKSEASEFGRIRADSNGERRTRRAEPTDDGDGRRGDLRCRRI